MFTTLGLCIGSERTCWLFEVLFQRDGSEVEADWSFFFSFRLLPIRKEDR